MAEQPSYLAEVALTEVAQPLTSGNLSILHRIDAKWKWIIHVMHCKQLIPNKIAENSVYRCTCFRRVMFAVYIRH